MTENTFESAAAAFATVSAEADTTRDMRLAKIAHAAVTDLKVGAFAATVSVLRAERGLASKRDAFKPSASLPTWDAFVEQSALIRPYLVSESTVRTLIRARQVITASGIDETDAVAFEDAKRAAKVWGKASLTRGTELKGESDPAGALAVASGRVASQEAEAAAKRAAARAEEGETDPTRRKLAALLRTVGILVNEDGSVAVKQDSKGNAMHTPRDMRDLADTLRAFAAYADRGAVTAAGGAAVTDLDGHPVADGIGAEPVGA